MSINEKENVIEHLTATANSDEKVSEAIKEIANKVGLEEEIVLRAFVKMEVEREMKA